MLKEMQQITCLVLDDIHPHFIQKVKTWGVSVHQQLNWSREEVLQQIANYDWVVINSKVLVDEVLLNKAHKLKVIARPGSGMENVNIQEATKRNIICLNSPEGNCVAVAEHTLGMILNWHHHISKSHFEVKNKIWLRKENTGVELSGKTIGIIGYGNVGAEVAKRAAAFNLNVLVYDKYKVGFGTDIIKECSSVSEICNKADIISFHVPLTPETKYVVNTQFINKCKKGVLIINTSRGEIANTDDIILALNEEKVGGLCLDVLENEKINQLNNKEIQQFEFLINHPKVLITPHIAGWTIESKYKMADVLISKLKNFLKIN